jgi:hypothetical protein
MTASARRSRAVNRIASAYCTRAYGIDREVATRRGDRPRRFANQPQEPMPVIRPTVRDV